MQCSLTPCTGISREGQPLSESSSPLQSSSLLVRIPNDVHVHEVRNTYNLVLDFRFDVLCYSDVRYCDISLKFLIAKIQRERVYWKAMCTAETKLPYDKNVYSPCECSNSSPKTMIQRCWWRASVSICNQTIVGRIKEYGEKGASRHVGSMVEI